MPEKEKPKITILQEWEGDVTKLDMDSFWVHLIDKSPSDGVVEEYEAEIPYKELKVGDKEKLQLGTFINWKIGLINSDEKQLTFSQIDVIEEFFWTEEDIKKIKGKVKKRSIFK